MSQTKKLDLETASDSKSESFVLQKLSKLENVDKGIKRQLLGYNEKLMAVRVWFEVGAVGQLHKHPHSQVAYVESGQFDVTVGEETKRLVAGDSFFVAPETMHGAVCIEAGVLIDMFSPMREDFLSGGDQS